jgi:GxxExxY protein
MIPAEAVRHRHTEGEFKELTSAIIGAAIAVHRELGPGLFEVVYEECFCRELALQGLKFKRQVHVPLSYKGLKLGCAYRLDVLVEDTVVVELKAIEQLDPIHKAQLVTNLRLTQKPIGLLINFNVPVLAEGVVRRVL